MKPFAFLNKIYFLLACLFVLTTVAVAQVPVEGGVVYPESYYAFRDNMLNSDGMTAQEFEDEYLEVIQDIMDTKSGLEREVLLARCDYVLGRAYRYLSMEKRPWSALTGL